MRKVTYDKDVITAQFLQSRYEQGFTRAETAREFNLTVKVLMRIESELGVSFKFKNGKKPHGVVSQKYLDAHREQFEKFLNLHNQGFTYQQIADACGCCVFTVGKIMLANGYKFSNEYKTKAAHDAVRGRKLTIEHLEKKAKGKELSPPAFSRWEILFRDFLVSRGIEFTPSKAIGKYNVDFAIGDSVAVELYGGAFHATGRAAARLHERMKYLINAGWNVYIIWCLSYESAIFPGCFDDFIAFLQSVSGHKSPIGQYRVIWSDGDFVSAGSTESDYLAAVKPAAFRHNALSKYKSARN